MMNTRNTMACVHICADGSSPFVRRVLGAMVWRRRRSTPVPQLRTAYGFGASLCVLRVANGVRVACSSNILCVFRSFVPSCVPHVHYDITPFSTCAYESTRLTRWALDRQVKAAQHIMRHITLVTGHEQRHIFDATEIIIRSVDAPTQTQSNRQRKTLMSSTVFKSTTKMCGACLLCVDTNM